MKPAIKAHILQGGALCSWALTSAVHMMDSEDIILSVESATEIHSLLTQHLLHWQGLAQNCQRQKIRRWKLRPKHHDLEELGKCVLKTRVNPRFTACWQDESYLGQIKMIAVRCHSATVLLRVFQRIILPWFEATLARSQKQRTSATALLKKKCQKPWLSKPSEHLKMKHPKPNVQGCKFFFGMAQK